MNPNDILASIVFGGDGGGGKQITKVEELSTDGGASDAGKVLVVGDNGKIAASDLTVGEGEIAVDKGLTVNGAAADAKKTGDAIAELNGSLGTLKADLGVKGNLDTTDKSNIVNAVNEVYELFTAPTTEAIADWLDKHPEATTTVQNGAIIEEKLADSLKLKTIKDYVTPEMFGAVGDGVTDDTVAFVAACESGKPVYVNNSLISTCVISNCKVKCNNLIITGTITCKSLDISGHIEVNGGSFVISRTGQDAFRDESKFEHIIFNIVSCETLLTIQGTLYNVRFIDNIVRGKCDTAVIVFSPDEWVTYTIISDSFLGTCDTPIIINGKSDGIQIVNTFAQRHNPTKPCRFITTSARGWKLTLVSSFMYDLIENSGDTNLYLVRGNTGELNYGSKFIISVSGQIGGSPFSSVFAKDSNGAEGQQLANEISNFHNDLNGQLIQPRPVKNGKSAFDFLQNISDFTSYGYAVEAVMPNSLTSAGTDIIGTNYRFGTGNNNKSTDVMIGADANGNIISLRRNVDNTNWTPRKYTSQDDFIGSAATPSALITDLNEIPVNFMGTKRLDASISPSGSSFYAPIIRFGNSASGGIFVLNSLSGTLYFAKLHSGIWGSWKQITMS